MAASEVASGRRAALTREATLSGVGLGGLVRLRLQRQQDAVEDVPTAPEDTELVNQSDGTPTDMQLSTTTRLTAYVKTYVHTGMRRIHSWFSSHPFPPHPSEQLWLLGICYGEADATAAAAVASVGVDDANAVVDSLKELDQATLQMFLADFHSRVWVTYRTNFPPLPGGLVSDVGWGCTLRSGQMLLANALLLMAAGRDWRLPVYAGSPESNGGALSDVPEAVRAVLALFGDTPSAEPLPRFGIHHMMQAGRALGVQEGRWLGPSQVCKALAALVNTHAYEHPGSLRAYVIPGEQEAACGSGGVPMLCKEAVHEFCCAAGRLGADAAGPGEGEREGEGARDGEGEGKGDWDPVLLLVPLVLGTGSAVNERYLPQLKAMLQCPQTVGIIGGSPGSSLYFVGYQEDQVFYLDPHDAHPTTRVDAPDFAASSYFCSNVRHMPLASIDPTLALGLLCPTAATFEAACAWVQRTNDVYPTTVLCTLVDKCSDMEQVPPSEAQIAALMADEEEPGEGSEGEENWGLV